MSGERDDSPDLQGKRVRVQQRMDSLEKLWPRGVLTFGEAWRFSEGTTAERALLSFSSTVADFVEHDPDRRLGISVRDGARRGAEISNHGSDERRATWQTMANEIWAISPLLSKSAVAQIIAKRCGGYANTIRQVISKPLPSDS